MAKLEQLEQLLKYVSENNEFYNDLGLKNTTLFESLPVIERSIVQKAKRRILSNGYLGLNMRDLITFVTSGSSGQPLRVYWNVKDYYKSMHCLWKRRNFYYNILPTSSVLNFNYNVYNNDKSSGKLEYFSSKNTLSINKASLNNEKAMQELVQLLGGMPLDWIYIQPSVLERILRYYIKHDIVFPKVKYIEVVGEILPESLRYKMFNYTGIKIRNMYGSEEMNGIAIECPYGNMHVISENVLVECMFDGSVYKSGHGSSVITNLHNKAMPFIRYNQGDEITLTESKLCKCGFCDPFITDIKGRQRSFVNIDGLILDASTVSEVIETVNNLLDYPITMYHFEYIDSEKKMIGYIQVDELYAKWTQTVIQEINIAFKKRGFSNTEIEIKCNQNLLCLKKKQTILTVR